MLKNSAGFNLPSYFSGIPGLNIREDGQWTCHSSRVKAWHPTSNGRYSSPKGHGLVDVRAIALVRLAAGFATSFYGDARIFPPPVFQDLSLVSVGLRIRRSHRHIVGFLVVWHWLRPLRWLPWRGLHHRSGLFGTTSGLGRYHCLWRSWRAYPL